MHWRIRLLGEVRVEVGERSVTRFESRHAALLLARLALQPDRLHPREELAALLWPDADTATGKARLRHVLSSLRRQLIPPGAGDIAPLSADALGVRLHRAAVDCDVWRPPTDAEDDLMPGFYDDWVQDAREARRARAAPRPHPAPDPAPPRPQPLLPAYLTPFFGRETERETIARELSHGRLVTLLGPGGAGKTRLAVEAARALSGTHGLTVFVALAECVDPRRIPDRLRAVLRLPATDTPAEEQVAAFLEGRSALLVLDNLEQMVASGAPECIAALLARLPEARCLATSRRPLGIDGERTISLAPLPVPDTGATLVETAAAPAVALWIDRARAVRPDFQITQGNHGDIAALCRALEGLPLALELAASRIRVLSVGEMRRQWDTRDTWLGQGGAARDKDPRHRSLTATLAWSWQMLAEPDRRFLAAMSVFRGGWSADAARFVADVDDAHARLDALVADSLVTATEGADGTTRFRMLDMVRAFVAQRLSATDAAALRNRHRAWFAAPGRDTDADNVVEALESACADHDPEAAYRIFVAGESLLPGTVGVGAAREIGARVLALPAPERLLRIRAIGLLSHLAGIAGDREEARRWAHQAIGEAGDDPRCRPLALAGVGRVGITGEEPVETLQTWLDDARAAAEAIGDRATESSALRRLGILALRRRDWDAGEALSVRSQRLCEAIGDERGARFALANVAQAAAGRGESARARALYLDCLERARAAGDRIQEGMLRLNLGWIHATRADWDAARAEGRACVRLARAVGNHRTLAFALWNLPEPMLHHGDVEDAARLLAFAARFWSERFGPLDDDDERYLRDLRAAIVGRLGTTRADDLAAEGALLPLERAVALALG